jgi:bifunctional DNA-binding transcriptional regulator/antitoxin component of YhaV-PrlF toxin-antitoxin module
MTLKLHYDGWLALPAGLRHKLGLTSGDRLEAELVGRTVVLRPAAQARRQTEPKTQAGEPPIAAASATPPVEAIAPAKRRPKRPKDQAVEPGTDIASSPPDHPESPVKRRSGRPRKIHVAEEPAAALANGAGEPWILRRKAERPAAMRSRRLLPAPRGSGLTQATSGRSATRSARSRCASSGRGAATTGRGREPWSSTPPAAFSDRPITACTWSLPARLGPGHGRYPRGAAPAMAATKKLGVPRPDLFPCDPGSGRIGVGRQLCHELPDLRRLGRHPAGRAWTTPDAAWPSRSLGSGDRGCGSRLATS